MKDFFISYNKADRPWAEWIAWVLEEAGYTIVVQAWDFRPGQNFILEMQNATVETNKTIAILSDNYLNALYTQPEWAAAFSSDPIGKEQKLLPIRVSLCEPKGLLASIICIDIVGASEEDALREILGAFNSRGKPSRPPKFPGDTTQKKRVRSVPFPGQSNNKMESKINPQQRVPTERPQQSKRRRGVGKQGPGHSFSPLELDTGAMLPDSPFYIERECDKRVSAQLGSFEPTVTIRGYRKAGKTSLLNRLNYSASFNGIICCYIDFQGAGESSIQNIESFFRHIAHTLVERLGVKSDPENYWSDRLSPEVNLTRFVENGILRVSRNPIQLVFDEVDILLRYPVGLAFFSTLRHWHNLRATDYTGVWRKLRFVIAHASDPAVWIPSTYQSPFNVGLALELEDLALPQVATLNQRLGSPLKSDTQIEELYSLIGGHPYLARRSLHALATNEVSFASLLESASSEDGPLGNHLRLYLNQVMGDTTLLGTLRQIFRDGLCHDKHQFDRLWATGLITSHKRNVVTLRCKLYEDFFRSVL